MATEIYKKLINLYKDSDTFYNEVSTALKAMFGAPPATEPDFLNPNKWEFFNYKKIFELFYNQFQDRFVRYSKKAVFQSFLVNNLLEGLYDLWIKTNWLSDDNIMAKLKDVKTRGNNVSTTSSNIQSPYPLDTKYVDKTSETYKKDEPIQMKSQSNRSMETFDVITDFQRVRGDHIRDNLNDFFESFNKLFIVFFGLQIL